MRKLAFVLGLGLFLLLVACNQTPTTDLNTQGAEYGQVRFGVVSDYLEGAEKTNFNGQWDKGEFLVPNFEIKLTPINEDGKAIGEVISYVTNQALSPNDGKILKLPAGIYQPELVLPTNLQGGDDYAWKPMGPDTLLPSIKIDPRLLADQQYTVACGIGRKWVTINNGVEFESSPCYFGNNGTVDGLYVSANAITTPCDAQSAQLDVSIVYKSTPSPVTLSASNLPPGMTASFNPVSTSTQSTLSLNLNSVVGGIYNIIVEDSRGQSVTVFVTVGVVVNVPDAILETKIKTALNIPISKPIFNCDMLLLTSFNAPHSEVTNLEGLQYARNLQYLNLNVNEIHDITPVSELTNLKSLYLGTLQSIILDINPLSRLTNLQELELWGNGIVDLRPLAGLTNLRQLNVDRNRISDLTPLSSLTNIQDLSLSWNRISDITTLSGLTNLQLLSLYRNSISDITPLVQNQGLGNGDNINLESNPLTLNDPNDPDLANIQTLQNRGATVHY